MLPNVRSRSLPGAAGSSTPGNARMRTSAMSKGTQPRAISSDKPSVPMLPFGRSIPPRDADAEKFGSDPEFAVSTPM